MKDRRGRVAVRGRREYYEGIVWASEEAMGASVSIVGCSEKELAEGA